MQIEDNSRNINIDELVEQCLVDHRQTASLSKIFDWDAHCYDFIDKKDADANLKIIESILDTENSEYFKWAERVCHRGRSFFMII